MVKHRRYVIERQAFVRKLHLDVFAQVHGTRRNVHRINADIFLCITERASPIPSFLMRITTREDWSKRILHNRLKLPEFSFEAFGLAIDLISQPWSNSVFFFSLYFA